MNKDKTLKETILEILDEELYPVYLEEMSTITTDRVDGGMCIVVNRSEFRKGNPYFKVVNHNSFDKATKIARISFLDLKYIIHKNTDGKENWILNIKEKKQLVKLFNQKSTNIFRNGKRMSNWEKAIAQYNLENRLIGDVEEAEDKKLKDTRDFETDPLPIDLPMPDYMKL